MDRTFCIDCPCLNSDYEYGETCNLGYELTSMYDDSGKYLFETSHNCMLEKIEYKIKGNGIKIFIPNKAPIPNNEKHFENK